MPRAYDFLSTVAGVTFDRPGQRPTQEIIAEIPEGSELGLERDRNNQYDSMAVRVMWNGEQIGFLPREDAWYTGYHLDAGREARCTASHITGGTKSKPKRGVNIRVVLPNYDWEEGERRRAAFEKQGAQRSAGTESAAAVEFGPGCLLLAIFAVAVLVFLIR